MRNKSKKFLLYCLCAGLVLSGVQGCEKSSRENEDEAIVSEYCYLILNYTQGGFLGDGMITVKVNDKTVEFFGRDYASISPFTGTTQTIINDLISKGTNSLTLEITQPASVAGDVARQSLICELIIKNVAEGQILDTHGEEPGLLRLNIEISPDEFPAAPPLVKKTSFEI